MPPRLEFPELQLQARSACAPFWSGRTESRLVLPLDQHSLKSIAQPHITSRRPPHIGVQDGRGPRASILLSSPWLDPYLDGESPLRLLRLFHAICRGAVLRLFYPAAIDALIFAPHP